MEYEKIQTLFQRDSNFNVTDELRHPVFAMIKQWDVDEKVDGTNIRIILDIVDGKATRTIGGRTNNAQIPTSLFEYLDKTFTLEALLNAFGKTESDDFYVVLYGEGYGAGIQACGGKYRKDKSFRLFDVLINKKYWANAKEREEIATTLGIQTVPYLGRMDFDKIVALVREGFSSITAAQDGGDDELEAEGIVARPIETLYDSRGNRVIIKLKTIDFKHKPGEAHASKEA